MPAFQVTAHFPRQGAPLLTVARVPESNFLSSSIIAENRTPVKLEIASISGRSLSSARMSSKMNVQIDRGGRLTPRDVTAWLDVHAPEAI